MHSITAPVVLQVQEANTFHLITSRRAVRLTAQLHTVSKKNQQQNKACRPPSCKKLILSTQSLRLPSSKFKRLILPLNHCACRPPSLRGNSLHSITAPSRFSRPKNEKQTRHSHLEMAGPLFHFRVFLSFACWLLPGSMWTICWLSSSALLFGSRHWSSCC